MEKLTIKVPYEGRTFVRKNSDGFCIQIKGIDVLDYQKGLISKSYYFLYFIINFHLPMIWFFVK